MSTWPLSWIDENTLVQICRKLIKEAQPNSQKLNHSNVIDPFSALFDMTVNNMTYDEWEKAEIRRQQQKTLQNAIGKFHQMVLGSVPEWRDMDVGSVVDLVNDTRKIYAEVKNKFNTVKGSDKIGVYNALAHWRGMHKDFKEYTGYYVQILVKGNSFDRPFTPPDNKAQNKPQPNEYIREVDGKTFYEMVTGSPTALADLYNILPTVLAKASDGKLNAEQVKGHPLYTDLYQKAVK